MVLRRAVAYSPDTNGDVCRSRCAMLLARIYRNFENTCGAESTHLPPGPGAV
jgi:hypothetical protein